MSKKKRLSHDQKRKAKLAKEARKNPQRSPLAYTGNKYKTDELVPIVYETELAIHEADAITGRRLPRNSHRLLNSCQKGQGMG